MAALVRRIYVDEIQPLTPTDRIEFMNGLSELICPDCGGEHEECDE